MTRGRKRQHDPSIPAHIDQAKLPRGLWWDRSGNGRWFVREMVEGRPKKIVVAQRTARLSELHALMEERAGIDRDTVAYVLGEFAKSTEFKTLAPRTRSDYEKQAKVADRTQTKLGKSLAQLAHARLSVPFVQRLMDHIAGDEGHPTKANQLLRYLRRAFTWAIQRGYATQNPFKGVRQAKERKARAVPERELLSRLTTFARERGSRGERKRGNVAPYLWIVMEIGYLCRLRPVEVITLTDANANDEGVLTNRRKGSNDARVRWTPRLRAAWDAATALRAIVRAGKPTPMRAEDRPLIVSEDGAALKRSSLDTSWQRLMHAAVAAEVITREQRFGLHALKHRGITDTPGTRGEKQLASGHKSERMLDVYDHSVPTVDPSGSAQLSGELSGATPIGGKGGS